jgi:hypothetical protein
VTINRDNYEDFFLLYVDNELNEAQRLDVENFVQHNQDLAKELDMLMQATLTDEPELKFEAKELLFKKEEGISLHNYEEYFLLAIDDELSNDEHEEVERFILKHPQLQDQFTLIKQAKLKAEVIEFKGKASLLRSEEKERRSISVMWIRMGIAAAVMSIVVSLWFFKQDYSAPNAHSFVSADKSYKPSSQSINDATNTKGVTEQTPSSLNGKGKNNNEMANEKQLVRQEVKSSRSKAKTSGNTTSALDETRQKESLASIQTPKFAEEKSIVLSEEAGDNSKNNSGINLKNKEDGISSLASTQLPSQEKSYAKEALYHEIDNSDEDKTIYIGGAEINKNKLKGLFKKAVNFLEKRAGKNTDEKTIQIAAFELRS